MAMLPEALVGFRCGASLSVLFTHAAQTETAMSRSDRRC
jgi:hypothetical protein